MPRGVVRTPAFMPVGTAGTVKAMYPDQVKAAGADIVLGNTYHLMLRPGAERVASLGGLHRFMNWPYPILTDSGGFQVMSLAQLRKIDETGVTFQSHIDGSTHRLTPERAIEIQGLLGADIQMQLDECVKLPASDAAVEKAMRLSLRWAERCRIAFGDSPGGRCSASCRAGRSSGCGSRARGSSSRSTSTATPSAASPSASRRARCWRSSRRSRRACRREAALPHGRRHAGRHRRGGQARHRHVRLRAADAGRAPRQRLHALWPPQPEERKHADDPEPIDAESKFAPASTYSKAYLHHLVRSNEILGMMLLTGINLAYYQELMAGLRKAIADGRLEDFVGQTKEGWAKGARDAGDEHREIPADHAD